MTGKNFIQLVKESGDSKLIVGIVEEDFLEKIELMGIQTDVFPVTIDGIKDSISYQEKLEKRRNLYGDPGEVTFTLLISSKSDFTNGHLESLYEKIKKGEFHSH